MIPYNFEWLCDSESLILMELNGRAYNIINRINLALASRGSTASQKI